MEERIVVTGGRPLNGSVKIPAAKNSVLPLFAASLLCTGEVRLQAVPRLADVEHCMALLRGVGCSARWEGSDAVLSGPPANSTLPGQTAGQMRASILFCAPLLARLGRAETSLPGGCRIGAKPPSGKARGKAKAPRAGGCSLAYPPYVGIIRIRSRVEACASSQPFGSPDVAILSHRRRDLSSRRRSFCARAALRPWTVSVC